MAVALACLAVVSGTAPAQEPPAPPVDPAGAGVAGRAVGDDGLPLAGVHVRLVSGSDSTSGVSGPDGRFRVAAVRPGPAVLRLRLLGYEVASVQIDVRGSLEVGTVSMAATAIELDGLSVAVDQADRVRDAPVGATVLDAREGSAQVATTADLLDRSAGVRVRQRGGLGSEADISIHGLSGRQVRVFVDGVPAEVLGPAGTVAAIPTVGLERIEVFKGVVPAELGADALGGALNLVTSSETRNSMHLSAGLGSFGARQWTARAQWQGPARTSAGVYVSHNRSDNDYHVDVTIPNEFNQPEPVSVRRFHDGYAMSTIRADLGVRSWGPVDRASVRVLHGREADEVQHNAFMTQPYGLAKASSSVTGAIASLETVSDGGGFATTGTIALSRVGSELVDTALSVFAWDGTVLRQRDYGGEVTTPGSLRHLDTDHVFARLGATLRLTSWGTIGAHATTTHASRSGADRRAAEVYGRDPYSFPSELQRSVLGVQYEHGDASELLTGTLGLKVYDYFSAGSAVENGDIVDYPDRATHAAGWLAAVRLRWGRLSLRGSVESATRLPEVAEVFGDLVVVRPNPGLRPERSRNGNLQADLAAGPIRLALGAFLRHTDDIVFLRSSQFFAQHQNLLSARSVGLDLSLAWRAAPYLSVTAEGTWQDLRNRAPLGASETVADRYRGARLPNVPYLFGNVRLEVGDGGIAILGVPVRAWWVTDYVHEFFLHWEIDGRRDSKAVIPRQAVHSAGVAVGSGAGRLLVEIQNVLDAPAFDVYSVQRPGRALQVQLQASIPSRS